MTTLNLLTVLVGTLVELSLGLEELTIGTVLPLPPPPQAESKVDKSNAEIQPHVAAELCFVVLTFASK